MKIHEPGYDERSILVFRDGRRSRYTRGAWLATRLISGLRQYELCGLYLTSGVDVEGVVLPAVAGGRYED